jgi:CPA1 family monovalent cation:H+ antiporter
VLVLGLSFSLAVIAVDKLLPGSTALEGFSATVRQIDFFNTLMNGMLGFLLFAGALQVDFNRLRDERWAVALMATIGVIISTVIIGAGFWLLAQVAGIGIPLAWAMVFGALISPTDPVVVLALLKAVRLPRQLEIKIAGESLFNDGVGVVVFTLLFAIAVSGADLSLADVGIAFLEEAVGGALLGAVAGLIVVRAMESIDDYPVEILITLALVTGLYAFALHVGASGPIAVVVAGLFVGNRGAARAMSETTRRHLFDFWEVLDQLLNSVLFLLIGLEILVIEIDPWLLGLAVAAIPLVLAARFISVSVPISLLSLKQSFLPGSIPILTWGGVRGGISVALALSLPFESVRDPILLATYVVVLFSIIVQGLTIAPLARRLTPESK